MSYEPAPELLRMFGWRNGNDFAVMVQRCLNCVADNPTPTVAEASP